MPITDPDFSAMPSIEFLGIKWLEPFTVLTDILITLVCWYGYYKLNQKSKENRSVWLIRMFLLTMGFATLVGGVLGHGLLYMTGMIGKVPGWYISMISVAFFERAALSHARPLMKKGLGQMFSLLNYIELTAFMILALVTLKFLFVELHAVFGLFIVVFFLEIYVWVKTRDRGSVFIFIATFFAAGAAAIHALKLGINFWFNHNDVSHLAMAAAVYFYYLAGKHMQAHENRHQ